MKIRALLLTLLVLLAGCSGSVEVTDVTTIQTATQTPTTTATSTTTEQTTTKTTTPPTTVEERPDNPWKKENVTVGIWGSYNQSRDLVPLVNETLAYWNENASEYGDYNVTFVLTPNSRGVDIVVELVPRIPECGFEGGGDSTVGCASVLKSYSTPDHPEKVRVVGGYSNESTVKILKHEFGHIMGVKHGEEPMPLMEPISNHTYLSQMDAEDREFPWRDTNLTVYVDSENWTVGEERSAPEQIEHTLEYFENGAEGYVPEDVTFERTENRSTADIIISWPSSLSCTPRGDQDDVCGVRWGHDIDTDPEFEYYSAVDIRVGQIVHDLIGWYVGYWIAYGFGLEGEDEMPPPWVDTDYSTASGEWWNE